MQQGLCIRAHANEPVPSSPPAGVRTNARPPSPAALPPLKEEEGDRQAMPIWMDRTCGRENDEDKDRGGGGLDGDGLGPEIYFICKPKVFHPLFQKKC